MIEELKDLLPKLPALIKDKNNTWDSLLIDKYPPVIHRVSLKFSEERTLLLHQLFNTGSDHALMHSHSWPFACKVLEGGYEMGVGFSDDRSKPPTSVFTSFVKSGDIYEMLSPNVWHYTKPINGTQCSYSVMLIGPRCRERKAENNSPLPDVTKTDLLQWFGNHCK